MSDIDNLIERLTERQQREYALKCARRVQHLMRDPRSIAVLDVAERHLRGEATDEELAVARAAARRALSAAVREPRPAARAAWAAARAALWAAVQIAARAASWAVEAAAWAASRDARDPWYAAWDAERAWQREELERMLNEGGGA